MRTVFFFSFTSIGLIFSRYVRDRLLHLKTIVQYCPLIVARVRMMDLTRDSIDLAESDNDCENGDEPAQLIFEK